jgi:hypothetical protein
LGGGGGGVVGVEFSGLKSRTEISDAFIHASAPLLPASSHLSLRRLRPSSPPCDAAQRS